MRENICRPEGLPPENGADCVAALEHRTTMPCALRLVIAVFRGNAYANNFKIGSRTIWENSWLMRADLGRKIHSIALQADRHRKK